MHQTWQIQSVLTNTYRSLKVTKNSTLSDCSVIHCRSHFADCWNCVSNFCMYKIMCLSLVSRLYSGRGSDSTPRFNKSGPESNVALFKVFLNVVIAYTVGQRLGVLRFRCVDVLLRIYIISGPIYIHVPFFQEKSAPFISPISSFLGRMLTKINLFSKILAQL